MDDSNQEQNGTPNAQQPALNQQDITNQSASQNKPAPQTDGADLSSQKAEATAQAPKVAPQPNIPSPQTSQTSQNKPVPPTSANKQTASASKESLWYLDNYILLRDYYERTVSRIAARCVRMGNIALEDYPHYSYILDVLQEISDTGNYVIKHQELYPYVEQKIKGGLAALRKNLKEYELELEKNSSPDMIKEDASEITKMKEALGQIDVKDDPTQGAGMGMDALMDKLMKQNQVDTSQYASFEQSASPDGPSQPKQN